MPPLAVRVVELPLQIAKDGTAVTVKVGKGLTVMITSAVDAVQGAFEMVHLRVADEPTTNPVTPEVGDEVVVTVAVPATTDHAPSPEEGELADNVVVVWPQSV